MSKPLLAVFGGTFDPFHRAHEWICREVLARPEVTRLHLVPCQIPALKGAAQASPEDRLAMLQAWVDAEGLGQRVVVDRRELDRPGPSYSVDTLAALQAELPGWRRVFVLGADAFASLARWEGVEGLIERSHFWVFARGREPIQPPELALKPVDSLADLDEAGGCWLAGPASGSDLASSTLRAGQASWRAALPPAVYHYVRKAGLYRPAVR